MRKIVLRTTQPRSANARAVVVGTSRPAISGRGRRCVQETERRASSQSFLKSARSRSSGPARIVTAVTNAQTAQVFGRATNAAGRASFGGLNRPPDVHLLQRVSLCEYRDNIQSDTRCFERSQRTAAGTVGTRATCSVRCGRALGCTTRRRWCYQRCGDALVRKGIRA
jgi:hypothetical protein